MCLVAARHAAGAGRAPSPRDTPNAERAGGRPLGEAVDFGTHTCNVLIPPAVGDGVGGAGGTRNHMLDATPAQRSGHAGSDTEF